MNSVRSYLKNLQDVLDAHDRSYDVLEWKDNKVYILESLFLFYLRWGRGGKMLDELSGKIRSAESVQEYGQALRELTDYLYKIGKPEDAQKLTETAALRRNRFSKREEDRELSAGKAAVEEYCRKLQNAEGKVSS